MSPLKTTVAAAAALVWSASSSLAQTFAFTAVVDSIDTSSSSFANLELGLANGDSFSGVLVLDPAAPDYLASDPSLGRYYNADSPMLYPTAYHASLVLSLPARDVTFGGIPSGYTGFVLSPEIVIANGTSFTPKSSPISPLIGDTFDFYHNLALNFLRSSLIRTVELTLNDPSGSVFGSDSLPSTLVLSSFSTATLSYSVSASGTIMSGPDGITSSSDSASFTSHLTSLTAIPEPSSLGLCLAASGLLLARRRGR